ATSASATVSATTTTAASAPAAVAASTSASAATFTLRPRFIHYDLAPLEILPVESGNGLFRFTIIADLDEPEPSRLSGEPIAN
ncbi:MAG: hypothetical protein WA002_10560, partial [Candidatus Acidiferrales bacterium]